MSVRNLPALLKPRSIVLIGASRRPGSVGSVLARNLFRGGFEGPVMAVHPQAASVESSLAYRSVEDLPMTPDLAVIATPPASVPDLVDRLGRRGTKAAVVISAGFGEAGSDDDRATGKALMQRMLDAARPHLLRLLGPNCVGLLVPPLGLNASFVHRHPSPGSIAFLTQSGAMATSVIDWAAERGIGFSAVASLGDMADVDFGDLLDYYGGDPGTRAILLYIETVTDARKFLSAGRAAARTKPVIVIKTGRTRSAARAAASHTGALAGTDAVYDAAFRRAGMLRVFDLEELFAATATLSSRVKVTGDRLAILSNGGGIGVLATEALEEGGGRVADLAPETMARLDAALPATWSHGNPVVIIGDAGGPRYAQALEALMDDPGSDAVLVLNCPTAVADPIEAAEAVVDVVAEKRGRPVLTSWLGAEAAQAARRLFHDNRIPTFDTPSLAVRGFLHMVRYRRNQEQLMETPAAVPDAFTPDVAAARALIARVRAEGRRQLTEPEAKAVLAAYGIPVVRTVEVDTPGAAG
ncbi:MAG: acetate--CoA ligase family protein, partial [Azospirillaceae bacterium]